MLSNLARPQTYNIASQEIKEEVRLIASDINIRLCGPRYLILLFDTLRSNLAQINIAENVGKKNNNYLNHSKNEKSLKKAFHWNRSKKEVISNTKTIVIVKKIFR